ncbi:hypothetical protein GCM10028775_47880 [Catellatospora paridis]
MVDGCRELYRGQVDDPDPAGRARLADRAEDGHGAGAVGEELVGVVPTGWTGSLARSDRLS